LLGLSEELKTKVREGFLTTGHAKVLLGIADINERERIGCEAIERELSVRETEKIVQEFGEAKGVKPNSKRNLKRNKLVEPEIYYWEEKLREKIGTKVKVKWDGQGKGIIEIEFYGFEDLERIDEVLRSNKDITR
jgi:ParB family chromosome partitioning protein